MESVEPKRLTYGVNVVWIGTVLDESTIEDFEKWFLEKYHYHIEYKDEFHIKSGMFKDLNCIIFAVPFEEIVEKSNCKIKIIPELHRDKAIEVLKKHGRL